MTNANMTGYASSNLCWLTKKGSLLFYSVSNKDETPSLPERLSILAVALNRLLKNPQCTAITMGNKLDFRTGLPVECWVTTNVAPEVDFKNGRNLLINSLERISTPNLIKRHPAIEELSNSTHMEDLVGKDFHKKKENSEKILQLCALALRRMSFTHIPFFISILEEATHSFKDGVHAEILGLEKTKGESLIGVSKPFCVKCSKAFVGLCSNIKEGEKFYPALKIDVLDKHHSIAPVKWLALEWVSEELSKRNINVDNKDANIEPLCHNGKEYYDFDPFH